MAKKYQIQHDRQNCIGCGACAAVAPGFWAMNEEGKSDLKGAKKAESGLEVIDTDEKDFDVHKEAADSCPVNVIHIIDKETKKKII